MGIWVKEGMRCTTANSWGGRQGTEHTGRVAAWRAGKVGKGEAPTTPLLHIRTFTSGCDQENLPGARVAPPMVISVPT